MKYPSSFFLPMKAMIFAAGLGTRLKPLTDTMPKALVPVQGTPLIKRTIQTLVHAGATEIVVNVHHFAQQLTDYINRNHWEVPVSISDESSQLLETGGGLRHASSVFTPDSTPILIHNVDILSNAALPNLYATHCQTQADATLMVSERKTNRYLLFDDDMQLKGWTNLATGEIRSPYTDLCPEQLHRYAFSGIHVFSPALFSRMESYPDVFSIIDFYLKECSNAHIQAFVQKDLQLLDVGKLDSLTAAEEWLSANHNSR